MPRPAATPISDEDLFRPTLTEEDDAVGFDQPWNPWSLIVLAFFTGTLAGGGLLAWNFLRLGMPKRVVPALVVTVSALLLSSVAVAWLWVRLLDSPWRSLLNVLDQVIAVAVCAAVAAPQHRRWRLFRGTDLPSGKLLWPGVGAAVVSLAAHLVLRGVLLFILLGSRA
jgi:hypothetical protein